MGAFAAKGPSSRLGVVGGITAFHCVYLSGVDASSFVCKIENGMGVVTG